MDYLREGRFEYSTPVPFQSNVKYMVRSDQCNKRALKTSQNVICISSAWCAVTNATNALKTSQNATYIHLESAPLEDCTPVPIQSNIRYMVRQS